MSGYLLTKLGVWFEYKKQNNFNASTNFHTL